MTASAAPRLSEVPGSAMVAVITAELARVPELTGTDLLILGRIQALSYEGRECWCSNGELAEFARVTPKWVSARIEGFIERGLLDVRYARGCRFLAVSRSDPRDPAERSEKRRQVGSPPDCPSPLGPLPRQKRKVSLPDGNGSSPDNETVPVQKDSLPVEAANRPCANGSVGCAVETVLQANDPTGEGRLASPSPVFSDRGDRSDRSDGEAALEEQANRPCKIKQTVHVQSPRSVQGEYTRTTTTPVRTTEHRARARVGLQAIGGVLGGMVGRAGETEAGGQSPPDPPTEVVAGGKPPEPPVIEVGGEGEGSGREGEVDEEAALRRKLFESMIAPRKHGGLAFEEVAAESLLSKVEGVSEVRRMIGWLPFCSVGGDDPVSYFTWAWNSGLAAHGQRGRQPEGQAAPGQGRARAGAGYGPEPIDTPRADDRANWRETQAYTQALRETQPATGEDVLREKRTYYGILIQCGEFGRAERCKAQIEALGGTI